MLGQCYAFLEVRMMHRVEGESINILPGRRVQAWHSEAPTATHQGILLPWGVTMQALGLWLGI